MRKGKIYKDTVEKKKYAQSSERSKIIRTSAKKFGTKHETLELFRLS